MTLDDIFAEYSLCYALGWNECLFNTEITMLVAMGVVALFPTVLALVGISMIGLWIASN